VLKKITKEKAFLIKDYDLFVDLQKGIFFVPIKYSKKGLLWIPGKDNLQKVKL